MTLSQVIRLAGDFKEFKRPQHGIASYYNGHIKDAGQRTRMAMLSLEDIEAVDWYVIGVHTDQLSFDDVRLKAQPKVGHTAEQFIENETATRFSEPFRLKALHGEVGRGVEAMFDPLCKCGHPMSDHVVNQSGPDDIKAYLQCRRTPSGVRCRCNGYEGGRVL